MTTEANDSVDSYTSNIPVSERQKVLDVPQEQVSGTSCRLEVPLMPRTSTADCTHWLTMHDPLAVVAWADPVVERFGHAPRSVYVETYWLPILGPSATWAMRRLTAWLEVEPDGYDVPLAGLSRELGLGPGTGRSATLTRTLSRLVAFGMATPFGEALAVRRMMPPLTRRQVQSLPANLAARHDAESARNTVEPLRQPAPKDTANPLSDTTSQLRLAPVDGSARRQQTGMGSAAGSGKPAAVPPGSVPHQRSGGRR